MQYKYACKEVPQMVKTFEYLHSDLLLLAHSYGLRRVKRYMYNRSPDRVMIVLSNKVNQVETPSFRPPKLHFRHDLKLSPL